MEVLEKMDSLQTKTSNVAGESNQSKTSFQSRFFPGDLVCYTPPEERIRPYEWFPFLGIVLSPQNTFVKHSQSQKTFRMNHEDGSSREPSASQLTEAEETEEKTAETASVADNLTPTSSKIENPENLDGVSLNDGVPDPVYLLWKHSNRIAAIQDRNHITLIDRHFRIGQYVQDFDGKIGRIVSSSSKAVVRIANTKQVLENISLKELKPLSPYVRGREICYLGWLGVITTIRREITSQLDTGHVFTINSREADGFMKADPYWGVGMPYPGNRNAFGPAIMKKAVFHSKWMKFLHRWVPPVSNWYNRTESTTMSVEVKSVDVLWLQKSPLFRGPDAPPPSTLVAEDLKLATPLGLPSYETIQLHSIRLYQVKDGDKPILFDHWFKKFKANITGSESGNTLNIPTSIDLSSEAGTLEIPVELIFRQCEVDIVWENGQEESRQGIDVPTVIEPLVAYENFPPGLVVEKSDETPPNKASFTYGIVVGPDDICTSTNMVKVCWITVETLANGVENVINEGMSSESIESLTPHPTICNFSRGTTVFVKDHPSGCEAGTVITGVHHKGTILISGGVDEEEIAVHPHMLIPAEKRSYWSFSARCWIQEKYVPPNHQKKAESD